MNKIYAVLIATVIILAFGSPASAKDDGGFFSRVMKKFTAKKGQEQASQKVLPASEQTKYQGAPVANNPIPQEAPAPANQIILSESAKSMSKESMIQEIKAEAEVEERLLETIPELKRQKDASGKESYTYNAGAGDVKLEDLDKETLEGLLKKVYSQADIFRSDMIMQQMETLRNIQVTKSIPSSAQRTPPASAPSTPAKASLQPPKR